MNSDKDKLWDELWDNDEASIDLIVSQVRRQQLRHPIFQYILKHYHNLASIEICEVGAGMALTSLSLGIQGAKVTLLDISSIALEKSKKVARALGIEADCIKMDILSPSQDMLGRFDVVLSFGLAEHFYGNERFRVIENHVKLAKPGGLITIHVPNAGCPFYRLWKLVAEKRGWWSVGFEQPFSRNELKLIGRQLPIDELNITSADFFYALNRFFLHKLFWGISNIARNKSLSGKGRPFHIPAGLNIPELQIPILQYFGYSLSLMCVKKNI